MKVIRVPVTPFFWVFSLWLDSWGEPSAKASRQRSANKHEIAPLRIISIARDHWHRDDDGSVIFYIYFFSPFFSFFCFLLLLYIHSHVLVIRFRSTENQCCVFFLLLFSIFLLRRKCISCIGNHLDLASTVFQESTLNGNLFWVKRPADISLQ